MPTRDHLHAHLALALGGALLVERLHWQIAAGVVAGICADRIVTVIADRRRLGYAGELPPPAAPAVDTAASGRVAARLPAALARTLGADCAVCRGFGCRTCAYTGVF